MRTLALLALSACLPHWTAHDVALEVATVATLAGDGAQTIAAQRQGYPETNPFLGPHPSTFAVIAYFVACAIGHAAVAAVLPPPFREVWQIGWTVGEVFQLGRNYENGVRVP